MSLLQQAIQLLSEAPGNVIYHLITLFALQAVFAITYSQWRRDRSNAVAGRMVWASGVIFLARLALLAVGIALQQSASAAGVLAPLEQAVHTITAVFLVWAFVPHSSRYPRLGAALLVLAVAVIGVMALSFTQTWQELAAAGEPYNASRQATAWGIMQLAVLGLGLVSLISRGRRQSSLPLTIIGLLLLAHVVQFGNYPEIIDTNTNIAYWIRLGHLVVLPLWAAWAYRYTLTPLLQAQQRQRPAAAQVKQSLDMAAQVIDSLEVETAVTHAIEMAARMTNATFVGLALVDEKEPRQLHLTSNQPQAVQTAVQTAPKSWYLNTADWPAFRQALDQKRPVALMSEGMGARQLHDWYQEMGTTPMGALLVQPLVVHNDAIGLLLLAGPPERQSWDEESQSLAGSLAVYVARAIDNGRIFSRASRLASTTQPEPETAVSGRIMALEEENDRLRAELDTTISRLQQSEVRAVAADRQARDLAATLNEIEAVSRDEQIKALEAEIEALRESLVEAEEAMALAAASEGELSTEWVMHTITRYSGQLEEAQERIEALEEELSQYDSGPMNEVITSVVQDLRTPMTSIAGYTDILLAERIGILGIKQREFVRRVQANAARMGNLLDHLLQLTMESDASASWSNEAVADVEMAVETAVSAVLTQIREKNLHLELQMAPDLPTLPVSADVLSQIMTSLLENACQVTPKEGRVKVAVRLDSMAKPDRTADNGHNADFRFIHLAVTDSGGGISVNDLSRVFNPQHNADSPLIAGLGDTGAALSVARVLAEANSGRLWVDSIVGVGSTFSALFPLAVEPVMNGDTAVFSTGQVS